MQGCGAISYSTLTLILDLTLTPQVPPDKVVVHLPKWTAASEEDIFREGDYVIDIYFKNLLVCQSNVGVDNMQDSYNET